MMQSRKQPTHQISVHAAAQLWRDEDQTATHDAVSGTQTAHPALPPGRTWDTLCAARRGTWEQLSDAGRGTMALEPIILTSPLSLRSEGMAVAAIGPCSHAGPALGVSWVRGKPPTARPPSRLTNTSPSHSHHRRNHHHFSALRYGVLPIR
jgi:hypothetical protein